MKSSVLLVDDEVDLLDMLGETLQKAGYHVLKAANGLEAVELLQKNKIDLMVSDIHMPGMDGIELLRTVGEKFKSIPVLLFISEYAMLSIEEAYDMGAFATLEKPFSRKLFIQMVDRYFENRANPWAHRPPRYPNTSEISIRSPGLKTGVSVRLVNIGRGGAYIRADGEIPALGSQVFFKIDFDSNPDVSLSGVGVVRWVREVPNAEFPAGFGIEFLFLDEPCRSHFKAILDSLGTPQFIPKN